MIIGVIIMIVEWVVEIIGNVFNSIISILPLIVISFACLAFVYLIYVIYEYYYYKSNKFLMLKNKIENNTKKCNELNEHIEDLKDSFIEIDSKIDYGDSVVRDISINSYQRAKYQDSESSKYTYNCSLSVFSNAQRQPFKYICKYFNISTNEDSLEKFERVLNDFSAAEQGKDLLLNERSSIFNSIKDDIPFIIKKNPEKLLNNLGFKKIDFSQVYFPRYSFKYISSAGNSSQVSDTIFNIKCLNDFIIYLSSIIKFKNSVAGQRALMTSSLREEIKKRDGYKCKQCSLSLDDEPNLLLEIDHIIPLSKKGMTSKDNLQTLCWKCNRRKSNKIL
jgi:hypothetical protein